MNKWLLCGNGFIAPRHIKAIQETRGKLVGIADIDESKRIEGIPFFKDYRDIHKEFLAEITHVAVCTPNYLHFEIAEYFATKGKIVLCEKPLTLNSRQLYELPREKVFTVLQLRYHPEVLRYKENLAPRDGELSVVVKREQSYWDGWKGDETKSGGILFNLGIHYFDLLFFLYGNNCKVLESEYESRRAVGLLDFDGKKVSYQFEIRDTNENQQRKLIIGNEVLNLSNKDNLSFEDLHTEVYTQLLQGNGIPISEASRAIQLIEFLK